MDNRTHGPATLLGDSAHLMVQYLAQGAASAFENDRLFRPALVTEAYAGFRAAGGRARLEMLPVFKDDGHRVFGDVDGFPVLLPHLLAFMRETGLPTDPVIGSGFAAAGDVAALPAGAKCRQCYAEFLEKPIPKAFAIGGTACGWWSRAERAAEACGLHAYDDLVVWKQ